MDKYFPKDVHGKKEIKFLELRQGNSKIAEYAARYEELVKFYPHYNDLAAEVSKCIKFENRLRPEIKQGIGYLHICQFPELVNKCRIFDQDSRDKASYFKNYNEKKGKNQDRGKSYAAPADKGRQRAYDKKKPSGGGAPASMKCYKCGELGHHVDACNNKVLRCYRCGYRSSSY